MTISGEKIKKWVLDHEMLVMAWLAIILLRLPNIYEPYWYGDEGIYLTVGQGMRRGMELYAHIVDHKTPLIYLISSLSGTLLGLKLWLIVSSLISTGLFYLILLKLLKNPWQRAVALVAMVLSTTLPAFEGNIANGEIILMPFTLGGIYLGWMGVFGEKNINLKKLFWSGVLFGLAILTKVPAGAELAAMGIFITLYFVQERRKVKDFLTEVGILAAGVILTIGLSILYFGLKGILSEYIDLGLFYNFRYIQDWQQPFTHPWVIFLLSMKGRLLLLVSYLVMVWIGYKKLPREYVFGLLWFGFSLFAALLSLRPYPHYFIQVLPAAALLMGFMVTREIKPWLISSSLIVTAYLVMKFLGFSHYPTIAYYQNYWEYMVGKKDETSYGAWFDGQVPATYEMARWLKLRTKPEDRIFIWGNQPMVFALADRSPATRFFMDFHIASFGAFEETLTSLRQTPPEYILDYRNDSQSFPEFYSMLTNEYVMVETINQATVYKHFQ